MQELPLLLEGEHPPIPVLGELESSWPEWIGIAFSPSLRTLTQFLARAISEERAQQPLQAVVEMEEQMCGCG